MTQISKVYNWDFKIVVYAISLRKQEFKWGVTDCATIVQEAVNLMYDNEINFGIGRWRTKSGAMKDLAKKGDIVDLLQSNGAKQIESKMTRGGDIVILDIETFSLGICLNSSQFLMSDEKLGPMVLRIDAIPFKHVLRLPDGNYT